MINVDLIKEVEHNSKAAVDKWGIHSQYDMMREEATELLLELARMARKRHNHEKILEELVDTYIMLHEMIYIYGEKEFERMIKIKLNKMRDKLAV